MDDVLCGQVSYSSSATVYEIQCGRIGTVVKIAQETTTKPLTLCEVEAFGMGISKLTFTSATQGSTSSNGVASRAIDGNTDGEYFQK